MFVALLILVTIFYKYSQFKNSCDYWDKGINGLQLNNNLRNECAITVPKGICWDVVAEGLFDLSWKGDCKLDKNYGIDYARFLKEYNIKFN